MSREQDCFETGRAAIVMPHWMADDDMALRHFDEAVASVMAQTDLNWMLVIVDDHTGREVPLAHLRAVEAVLGPRGRVIYSDRRLGPGLARNLGIRAAAELGAPFILFLDADDLADPRRLERTRAAFCSGSDVNVVYSSHDFIDEYGHPIPLDSLAPTVREAVDGHRNNPVEGEDAWIQIATRKNYANLTSCTAVRMSLALAEPFPDAKVSEDAHTWMRYGAHPGRFVFLRDIRNHYRIRTGTQSQSRSRNPDFYAMKAAMDRDGFEQALVIAARHGRVEEQAAQDIRTRFYVRLALSMLRGPDIEQATLCLQDAWAINHRTALAALADLEAGEDEKQILLALIHTHDKTQKSCSGTACSELIHH